MKIRKLINVINDLDDVVITSVADNELLVYDSASGNWINQTSAETGLDAIYLKLDASNDPITAGLEINAATTSEQVLKLKTTDDNTTYKVLEILSSADASLASIAADGTIAGINVTSGTDPGHIHTGVVPLAYNWFTM